MNYNARKTITIDGEKITATIGTLNEIGIWASEVAGQYKREGYNGLANRAQEISDEIFVQLKNFGVYD